MAKEIVIFPGGFHPIHPGHVSVYNALKKAFPAAEVYIASSDSTKERPFPFDDKKVLATAAGIPTDKFVEVVSPYKAMEITKNYDPSKDLLIFGLSAKDASRLSYTKKDGTAGYFQKYVPGTVMDPFEQHAYVYIAPTVTFKLMGQAVSSASIIRKMYGEADDAGKYEILKELYPKGDPKKIKTIFDRALTTSESTMPPRYKYPKHIEEDDPTVFIKKVSNVLRINEHIEHSKNGWTLFSKKTHKRLGGPYASKEQAIKRERQVAYFKHMGENKMKTFKQFSEEEDALDVTPKADQEVILELDIPSEVKKNIDAGFDLLKQNDNKGANSSIIAFAKKLQSGEQADKDMLALWQAKFKIHQTSKDRGWGKKSDKELQQLLAKATPDGYIPWMLLGGNEGKKFVDDSLQSLVKEESLNEVSPEGIAAMRRMGMQKNPEGDLARANYERLTRTKWSPPEATDKKQPTPEPSKTKSKLSSFLSQTLGFECKKEEIIPGRPGMVRYVYSNSGKVYKEVSGWTLRVYYRRMRQTTSQPIGVTGWYLFSPDSEVDVYDSGKTMEQLISVVKGLIVNDDPNPK